MEYPQATPPQSPCTPGRARTNSLRHLAQQSHDLPLHLLQLGVDLSQRTRRHVLVEVAVEVDLVADDADLAVLAVTLALVDPGIGYVGCDLTGEVVGDGLPQGTFS
jgi:hypothetical protein